MSSLVCFEDSIQDICDKSDEISWGFLQWFRSIPHCYFQDYHEQFKDKSKGNILRILWILPCQLFEDSNQDFHDKTTEFLEDFFGESLCFFPLLYPGNDDENFHGFSFSGNLKISMEDLTHSFAVIPRSKGSLFKEFWVLWVIKWWNSGKIYYYKDSINTPMIHISAKFAVLMRIFLAKRPDGIRFCSLLGFPTIEWFRKVSDEKFSNAMMEFWIKITRHVSI